MLTAYKITYADGTEISTNMAAGITLEDAEKYFLGKHFDIGGSGELDNIQIAVKVEELKS